MDNIVRLNNHGVKLCTFRTDEEAISLYNIWANDVDICQWMGTHRNVSTLDDTRQWASSHGTHECRFNIISSDDVLIGYCSVVYSPITAYIDICIGNSEYRGKGYGKKTLETLIDFSFNQLNVNRIELSANSKNVKAILCYKSVGFVEFGTAHESDYFDGEYCDIMMMEILRKNYNRKECIE